MMLSIAIGLVSFKRKENERKQRTQTISIVTNRDYPLVKEKGKAKSRVNSRISKHHEETKRK